VGARVRRLVWLVSALLLLMAMVRETLILAFTEAQGVQAMMVLPHTDTLKPSRTLSSTTVPMAKHNFLPLRALQL